MKIRGLIIVVFALALALSLAHFVNTTSAGTAPKYSAQLISPTAGQVLYPGQIVRVEWTSVLPKVHFFESCESEVRLSLDGGSTFPWRISPYLDPRTRSFYWTVPNTLTNAAVMDIRFGCEQFFPETFAPQRESTFVIAKAPGA